MSESEIGQQLPRLGLLRSLSQEELLTQRLRSGFIRCVNLEHPKFQTMILHTVQQANYACPFSRLHIQQVFTQPATYMSIEYYLIFCLDTQPLIGRCVVNVVSRSDDSGCPQIKETELLCLSG